jgi:SOS-response transcriptional repressor LexA
MNTVDARLLALLRDYFQLHRTLPSFAEVAKMMEIKSTSKIVKLINQLKDADYLQATPSGRLAPGRSFFEREIVEHPSGSGGEKMQPPVLSIDQFLIKVPSRTVLLRVSRSTMGNVGIMQGDWVVVQRGAPALPGHIIVGVFEDEFEIGYLEYNEQDHLFSLRTSPVDGEPEILTGELEIFGRVIASYRTY